MVAIGMISELICYMFKIRKAWQMWLIGCLLISTPSIATMLVYQALDYFGIAALLAVLAAVLLSRNTYFHRFLGVLCLTFSVGAYQPFLGFTLTLLVLDCIVKLIKNTRIKDVLFDGMRYVLGSGIALGLYYIILNIILRVKNIELSSYKGMDSVMTNINPLNLINSIYKAYCDVLNFFVFDILGIQGRHISWINILVIVLILICFIYVSFVNKSLYNIPNMILSVVLILCIPISVNIVGVLSGNKSFYYISIYSFYLVSVISIILINSIVNTDNLYYNKIWIVCRGSIVTISTLLCLTWAIQNNTAYQKAEVVQKQLTTAGTILGMKIQNIPGFTTDKEVVLVGEIPYDFLSEIDKCTDFPLFATSYMGTGGVAETVYDPGVLMEYMRLHLGLKFNYLSQDVMRDRQDEIGLMPIYPNDGSIMMIDGVIVIKLSEMNVY